MIADDVLAAIDVTKQHGGLTAYTLSGGYACAAAGHIVRFEPGREVSRKTNKEGRTTRLITEYKDGSRLLFTWSEANGSNIKLIS